MADITLEQLKEIYTAGQPVTALHLITSGKVSVSYPGGHYTIGKGDIIGICEVSSEIHFLSYDTTEETSILTYPLSGVDSLVDLLRKHPDVARLFLMSAFRQINLLLEAWSNSELNCSECYRSLRDDYNAYLFLCDRYRLTKRHIDGVSNYPAFIGEEQPDLWLNDYYTGLTHVYATDNFEPIFGEPYVSLGLLQKCSLDFRKAIFCLQEQSAYLQELADFYFTPTGNDLFDIFTSLYYKLKANGDDAGLVLEHIRRMETQMRPLSSCDDTFTAQRINSFENNIANLLVENSPKGKLPPTTDTLLLIQGSLNIILDFAGADLSLTESFRTHIHQYRRLNRKNSMDDEACKLREVLAEEYYALYTILFVNTLSCDPEKIPIPVLMFLYFGYVDEELSGMDNAIILYRLAQNMPDNSEYGIYTFYHWLKAIFEGKKNPSHNEFDLDFFDYLQKQKLSGAISADELKILENNAMSKINFEIHNMFPIVNQKTYGRPTAFCPIFYAENVLKNPDSTFVTLQSIHKAIESVKKADYSAFYRESLATEHYDIVGKEVLHKEYLPDVILMPNIGTRPVMWQEIEGKVRNSPGRICISIFHLEDLFTSFIRATAEFRWELCKRIQGSRWNDVTDRSLTSEYCDYLEYYKKNTGLSADAKERIRLTMQRSKNSYKEMFIRDYTLWILFESNGSARLNRVARKIMFTYCPFPAPICTALSTNPLYSDMIKQQEKWKSRRLHHLGTLRKKFTNANVPIPEFIEEEEIFAKANEP